LRKKTKTGKEEGKTHRKGRNNIGCQKSQDGVEVVVSTFAAFLPPTVRLLGFSR
jgi:hypothetical protein